MTKDADRETRAVRAALDSLEAPAESWLLVCGSTPPGVPVTFLSLIHI